MSKKLPDIPEVCADCGYPIYQHRLMGPIGFRVFPWNPSFSDSMEYQLRNPHLKQTCNVIYKRNPLGGKPTLLSRVTKGKKRVPVGKRRQKRGQGKPR